MPDFQLVCCHVAIAGDQRQVVPITEDSPITFPEMCILQSIHGVDAVTDVFEVGFVNRTTSEERKRLSEKYTPKPVESVFPGSIHALPAKGDFPTKADIEAAQQAASEAMAKRKASKAKRDEKRLSAATVEVSDINVEV